jgi:maleate isomerase
MTDALAQRAVFAVVVPATNTVTEPDMAALRPAGVSNQTFRFPFPGRPDSLGALIDLMGATITFALDCRPDRVIVGFSAEFLPDGLEVASRLRAHVEGLARRPTTMASDALPAALKALGAKRIGIVTPYAADANRNVAAYFAGLGFAVSDIAGIARTDKGRIDTVRIAEAEVRAAIAQVCSAAVDAVVQVGTAMVCAGFAADLERHHGKPVVAANAATYWMALRQHGIPDRLDGHGTLLGEF